MSILKVSIGQIKAARALLGWSQGKLAAASGVSEPTIKRLEAAAKVPTDILGGRDDTVQAIRIALESAGVVFLDDGATVDGGPGVRLRGK